MSSLPRTDESMIPGASTGWTTLAGHVALFSYFKVTFEIGTTFSVIVTVLPSLAAVTKTTTSFNGAVKRSKDERQHQDSWK